MTGAQALFRAARQKIKHPLPVRKRVGCVLIRCFCHFAVYRSVYRSYFVMHFYAAVSVHLYFSSFIFINILLFYPAPFLPYCCRLTVYRTGKAEKLQARQEYRKARPWKFLFMPAQKSKHTDYTEKSRFAFWDVICAVFSSDQSRSSAIFSAVWII